MNATLRAVVRKCAEGEYVQHDTRRFFITWDTSQGLNIPAPGYGVMVQRAPDFGDGTRDRLMLYRAPSGTEWIGHADAESF